MHSGRSLCGLKSSTDSTKLPDSSPEPHKRLRHITIPVLLPAVDAMCRTLYNSLRYLTLRQGDVALNEARDVTSRMSDRKLAKPDSVSKLLSAVEQLVADSRKMAESPNPDANTLVGIGKKISEINSTFRKALLEQTKVLGETPQSKPIVTFADQRNYSEAARELADALPSQAEIDLAKLESAHESFRAFDGGPEVASPTVRRQSIPVDPLRHSASWLESGFVDPTAQSLSTVVFASTRDAIDQPLDALEARTKMALLTESSIRWIATAVLTVLVAYGLFAEKYVGTFSDFTMIFFWGFACDVSVDTVMELAKDLKKR